MARTKVIFVLDRSGSMRASEEDVRGGFDSYLRQLREDTATEYHVCVTLFDTQFERLWWDMPLASVPPLSKEVYFARGSTALWDAVGKTLQEVQALPDEKILFVVYTDGYENSSREWTGESVKKLIDEKKKTGTWDFVFLGADIDAWALGMQGGFDPASVAAVGKGRIETQSTFDHLAKSTKTYSGGGQTVSRSLADMPEEAKSKIHKEPKP